jgi:MFS transporter, DHA2 family, multidrug resistance protein
MTPPQPGQAALPVRNRALLTVGVMGAMVIQILDTTIANVALPHMQSTLGATSESITWVLTSYIVASAIAIPMTGWLSERFGSRNLFLFAVGGFIVTSMLCGTAVNLEEMVLFRVLQGITAAFINPLSQTAMLDINPPERHAKAMSVWGMGVMVGPILGPVIGGWLTESYSWRWVFYVNVPLGGLTLAILWFLLPSRPRRQRSFDMTGFALIALAVASFQLMLDRGQSADWFSSWEIIVEAAIAAAALWMAVVHLATAKNPLFDRHLFKNRNLMTGMLFMLVIGLATMAPMALLPPMLQGLFGYPVIDTGLLLAPRGVGVLVTMFVAGQLMSRIDPRWMISLGLVIFSFSLWEMSGWSLQMDWRPVVLNGFIQGLGMGLVFMPLNAMAFATLSQYYRTDGSSLLNLFRSIGASAGISMVTMFLQRNGQISHADIASNVTQQTIPSLSVSQLEAFGGLSDAGMAMINAEVTRQAMMIAYLDDFYLMAIIALTVLPFVLLLKRPKAPVEVVHSE